MPVTAESSATYSFIWLGIRWRQSERGYRILEAGLLSADSAIADAIEKLLEHGIPFFRRVAAAA